MTPSTHDRILQAALPLFVRRGIGPTRTEEICQDAGVSNGSLFHFFRNKDALAAALYVRAIASYQSALLAELDEKRPAAQTLAALIAAHWAWIGREELSARFLFAQGAPSWHPDAAKETEALNRSTQAAFAAWRSAPAQRAALTEIPEEAFTPVLLGPSMMATRLWLRAPDADPPHHLVPPFTEAALRSLLKRYGP